MKKQIPPTSCIFFIIFAFELFNQNSLNSHNLYNIKSLKRKEIEKKIKLKVREYTYFATLIMI